MSDLKNSGKYRRIHFLSDVREVAPGVAYECLKCGHATGTKVEMYEHRKGLVSRCFRGRLMDKLRALRTGNEQQEARDDE